MALTGQAKKDYQREYMRRWMSEKRNDPQYRKAEKSRQRRSKHNGSLPCEVCGYSLTTDTHHENKERIEHRLCPNCHALITRGIKTLDELLNKTPVETQPVIPIVRAVLHPVIRPYSKSLQVRVLKSNEETFTKKEVLAKLRKQYGVKLT